MNNEKYHLILIYYSVLSGKHLIGNKFVFQHDNDPKESWTGLPRANFKVIEAAWDLYREQTGAKIPSRALKPI